MNKEQQEVFSLLVEIDKICRENHIPYYLSPQLTLRAVMHRPLSLNPLTGCVVMKTGDMERFRRAFRKKKKPGRVLESMYSYRFFPGFYLRYENTDTTCYCLHVGKNFRDPGLGVNILPLRGGPASDKKEKILGILETGWLETCYSYGVEWKFSSMMWGAGMRMLCLFGRRRVGKSLYKLFVRGRENPREGVYLLKSSRTETRAYPANIFSGTREAQLEGYSFLIPENYKTYLKTAFGENYARISPGTYRNNFTVMTSAEVGCRDFLKEIGSQEHFLKARRRQFLTDTPMRRTKEHFEEAWDHIKLYGTGSEMKTGLREKKEYIFNLYQSGDLMRLESVFRPYTRWIQRCMEKGEFYPLDQDLMEIYLNYLEETAQGALAGRLRANDFAKVPKSARMMGTVSADKKTK